MPSLSDLKTQSLLEAILGELREIRKELAEANASQPTPDYPPYIPDVLGMPPRTCSRCGISLNGVMGYVCNDPTCPTGLGPTTC